MANNPDIIHINIIEGLATEIQSHLSAISPQTAEQAEVKDKAMNRFNAWQINNLHELRLGFENRKV